MTFPIIEPNNKYSSFNDIELIGSEYLSINVSTKDKSFTYSSWLFIILLLFFKKRFSVFSSLLIIVAGSFEFTIVSSLFILLFSIIFFIFYI